MSLFTIDDQFLDSSDFGQLPCTITADIQTDKQMNTQSIELKSVVMHIPMLDGKDTTDVQMLHLLTPGTIQILADIVAEKHQSYWENGDGAA